MYMVLVRNVMLATTLYEAPLSSHCPDMVDPDRIAKQGVLLASQVHYYV
jgi:hypothetical protein